MPLLSTAHHQTDQARELRALVAQRAAARPVETRMCRSLAVVSGKGGVGKSVIALNLAVALAQRGDSVCLVDASPGLGHLELLCGRNGYWNLTHVAAGSRRMEEVVQDGPHGVRIVSGASCLLNEADYTTSLLRELSGLERECDWLIFDTAGGESRSTNRLASVADRVLIVTTPETTAIAEAYAALKGLSATDGSIASVLVNRTDSEQQAHAIGTRLRHAAKSCLRTDLDRVGFIPEDAAVAESVSARQPLVDVTPNCAAQLAIAGLAERLARTVVTREETGVANEETGYFQRLMPRESAADVASVSVLADARSARGNLIPFSPHC